MEILIIGASALVFLVYIFFYRYFGIDAKVQMFVIHSLLLAYIVVLVILLSISISGDYGNFAITSAIAAISGFGTVVLKYLLAELVGKKK